ncbi:3008_t:CDS:2 [Entrophospora sp. SA101]|nr:12839_t:CDS:2 [Entrophospora sp. SA101]CAJ0632887.1 3008_t:CDS:2 [Entrophospora sp. SA101]CAJ0843051.1 2996_t:CDS:2 [Entrophospora sp. SA101]
MEGTYGWITVNYLMNGFINDNGKPYIANISSEKPDLDVDLDEIENAMFQISMAGKLLHERIDVLKIIDSGGPPFQGINNINNIAVSWALGKMVLEASASIKSSEMIPPPLHPQGIKISIALLYSLFDRDGKNKEMDYRGLESSGQYLPSISFSRQIFNALNRGVNKLKWWTYRLTLPLRQKNLLWIHWKLIQLQ